MKVVLFIFNYSTISDFLFLSRETHMLCRLQTDYHLHSTPGSSLHLHSESVACKLLGAATRHLPQPENKPHLPSVREALII